MKKSYIKPSFEFVELRSEERMADCWRAVGDTAGNIPGCTMKITANYSTD